MVVRMNLLRFPLIIACLSLQILGCGRETPPSEPAASEDSEEYVVEIEDPGAAEEGQGPEVIRIGPGPDAQTRVQEELILAEPGAVIEFEEGVYEFTRGLSLDVQAVTLRGAGMDKTIFDFKNQDAGAEGLYIASDDVIVEDLAVRDAKGNAIKSHSADRIVYRRVKTEWTGGPKPTNGAYGLYPVSSENVLIEECVAVGASDAGIYVGQSRQVVVRNCTAEYNVAGIEIENCHFADVYGCLATNNTGGILVFDLPDLPQQKGRDVRIFENRVFGNNTKNFAPAGNMVATVPTGTGIMVMANSNVEVFENDVRDHNTTNVMVISYLSTGLEINDPNYYPYPERIHIHHNTFGACGANPGEESGELMKLVLGVPLPDIVWDGVVNEEKLVDGALPDDLRLKIRGNLKEGGEVGFGSLGGVATLMDPTQAKPSRDLTQHEGEFPPIEPVVLEGVH